MRHSSASIVGVDKVNPSYILGGPDNYFHVLSDIAESLHPTLVDQQIHTIIHLAAQSHVDTSISVPYPTIKNNVMATQNMLDLARHHQARFIHISTDEVFGSLSINDPAFTIDSQYRPNSPYSASKAASDHIVRAYRETYGIDATIINSSNNFGPGQNREKLIPKVIFQLINKRPIPVYGDGKNVRDWIHVDDFSEFILKVLKSGKSIPQVLVGSNQGWSNIRLVTEIIQIYERLTGYRDLERLIDYVQDRPGHDFRYQVNNKDARDNFNWRPRKSIFTDLHSTVKWYLDNVEFFAE